MKNVYDLLKEIDIDERELVEMEVSDLEKARVKKAVKGKITKPSKNKNRWIAAAATIGLLVSGAAYIGINHPAYAAEIPIVGDIFRFLDNGRTGIYDNYQEYANEVNVTKESNGIEVTIREAFFDGLTLSYTYEIRTKRDLNGNISSIGIGPSIDIRGYRGGLSGSAQVVEVEPGVYVGQENYSIDQQRERIDARLKLENLLLFVGEEFIEVEGQWEFDLSLDAIERDIQQVNQSVAKDGLAVTINQLSRTPVSTIIEYSSYEPEEYRDDVSSIAPQLEIRDDLGNRYSVESNGGGGNVYTGEYQWSDTVGMIHEDASQLIISVRLRHSGYGGGAAFDEDGNESPIEIPQDKRTEDWIKELGEIVIDLE